MMLSIRHASRWTLAFVVASGTVTYAQETAATLAKAQKALAERRPGDAIVMADSILRARPGERAAYAVKIDAYLASGQRDSAFNVYEAFTTATRQQSAVLIAPIARDVLREFAAKPSGGTGVQALEHLARAGDNLSRATLERLTDGPEGGNVSAVDALARLGDAGAQRAVRQRLDAPVAAQRAAAVTLLAGVAPASVRPSLGRLLADPDLDVQLAALQAAEDLRAAEASTAIETLLNADVPLVRLSAAAALVRLGNAAGRPLMERALKSEVADARLIAAQALSTGPVDGWAPTLRAMLGQDTEVLVRLQAASLLLPVDRAMAVPVLAAGAKDPNPAIRDQAARLLVRDPQADVALLWPLLRDDSPWVRTTVAGALLDLAGRPAAGAAPLPRKRAAPAPRPGAATPGP